MRKIGETYRIDSGDGMGDAMRSLFIGRLDNEGWYIAADNGEDIVNKKKNTLDGKIIGSMVIVFDRKLKRFVKYYER